ncbi:MAG: hypothetical protein HS116_27230 [Planctomycetes bacterium]|nr:hypothetical protein [Planctomycetota bacterium]
MRNRLLVSGWVAACAFTAAFAAETVSIELALPAERVGGFRKEGEYWVPLKEAHDLDGGALTLDAGATDERLWALGGGMQQESGGPAYAAGFKLLRWYVQSAQPRKVAVWARMRHSPRDLRLYVNDAIWSPAEEIKAAGRDLKDKDAWKDFADTWRWVKLAEVECGAGLQALQVIPDWPGYNHSPLLPWPHHFQIEKLVLVEGGAAPEQSGAQPRKAAVKAYWIETAAHELPPGSRLESLKPAQPMRAKALQVSSDGGKTWVTADSHPAGAKLTVRAVFDAATVQTMPAQRADPAQRQASPSAAAEETSRFAHFSARIQVPAERVLKLENTLLELVLDTSAHGVLKLTHRGGKTEAAPATVRPLFALELKKRCEPWPEPRHVLEPKQGVLKSARVRGKGTQAELEYLFLDGKLKAKVSVDLGAGLETQWALELDNKSEWDVLTYTFPRLGGLRIGSSGYDDAWLNTNFYGPWMPGSAYFAEFRPEDREYPGWGALGYASLYDPAAGLTVATLQPRDGATHFLLRPERPRYGETVTLDVQKEHCVAGGEKKTWSYALYFHDGDWHSGADWYRSWFRSAFGVADHFPDWARDGHGWLQYNSALHEKHFKWPQLWDLYEKARRMGLNHVQVWGQFGANSCSAFWWPSPNYGTQEEFAAVNRKIRDAGGHIGYYLMYDRENRYNYLDAQTYEGYLPRSAYPEAVPMLTLEQFKRAAYVKDPAGKPDAWPANEQQMQEFRANLDRLLAAKELTTWAKGTPETWPKSSMINMNPLDETWYRHLEQYTVDLYAKRWNADSPYQDVLGIGHLGRSFDLARGDHGHVHNSEYLTAKRLFEAGQKADKQFTLLAEGKSNLVTRWAVGMTSNQHYGWRDLRALRYTHPDHILALGGSNGGYHDMRHNCELSFLFGTWFDIIPTDEFQDVHKLVRFRTALKRWATRGVYRDTVGVKAGGGLLAARHDRIGEDVRAILIPTVRPAGVEQGQIEVDVAALGERYGAFWLTEDGDAKEASMYTFERGFGATQAPAAGASALLCVAQAPAGEDLLGGVVVERRPQGLAARVWIANLTDAPRTLPLLLEAPGAATPVQSVALKPFGVFSHRYEMNLPNPGAAHGFVRLLAQGKPIGENYLYPLYDDPSFERRGTAEAAAPDGQRILRLPPKEGWQGHGGQLWLEPGHRYRIGVKARRGGAQGQMHGLVILKLDSGKQQHVGLNFPKDQTDFSAWLNLSAEFETPPDLKQAQFYLYNSNSKETVDYDDIRVEMLK